MVEKRGSGAITKYTILEENFFIGVGVGRVLLSKSRRL